jgi:hypothetical protein
MTLLVIIGAIVWGGMFAASHDTSYVFGPVTVYVIAFAAGLAAATVAALLSRARRNIIAAGVLVLSLAGSHLAWVTSEPVFAQAIVWTATAAYFALAGRERWELVTALACLAGLACAGATALGIIPDPSARPPVYLAWNFADLSSLIGHISSIMLGVGSGDWGRRARDGARRPARMHLPAALLQRVGG